MKNLTPFALSHDAYWAIEEEAARILWQQLLATDAATHLAMAEGSNAEIQARRASMFGDEEESKDKPYSMYGGIAMLELCGVMTKNRVSYSSATSTRELRRQIRTAANDPDVKAILLVVDSPGGSVSGTDELALDIAAAAKRKPFYAFVDDLCASAALWAASQATKVYANATALIGSIGVYTVVTDSSKLYGDAGVKVHVVSTGQFKGAGTPGTEITPEQLDDIQTRINGFNDFFIKAVSRGRKLTRETVEGLADGRVHMGKNAVKLGLADAVATLDEVLGELQALIGSKRACSKAEEDLETISALDGEPLSRTTVEQDLTAALSAARKATPRLEYLVGFRKSQGRRFSPATLAMAEEVLGGMQGCIGALEAVIEAAQALPGDPAPRGEALSAEEQAATDPGQPAAEAATTPEPDANAPMEELARVTSRAKALLESK